MATLVDGANMIIVGRTGSGKVSLLLFILGRWNSTRHRALLPLLFFAAS